MEDPEYSTTFLALGTLGRGRLTYFYGSALLLGAFTSVYDFIADGGLPVVTGFLTPVAEGGLCFNPLAEVTVGVAVTYFDAEFVVATLDVEGILF